MARHFGLPCSQPLPRATLPYLFGRAQQSAGVSNGPAANGATVENGNAAEETHAEETAERHAGTPKPPMDRPVGLGQVVGGPTTAHFHYCGAVTFFGESQRRDAAAKAGANDDEIEIELFVAGHWRFLMLTAQITVGVISREKRCRGAPYWDGGWGESQTRRRPITIWGECLTASARSGRSSDVPQSPAAPGRSVHQGAGAIGNIPSGFPKRVARAPRVETRRE